MLFLLRIIRGLVFYFHVNLNSRNCDIQLFEVELAERVVSKRFYACETVLRSEVNCRPGVGHFLLTRVQRLLVHDCRKFFLAIGIGQFHARTRYLSCSRLVVGVAVCIWLVSCDLLVRTFILDYLLHPAVLLLFLTICARFFQLGIRC